MKHSFKKLTAWLCCMAMLISFIPATALPVFAAETTVTYTEDTDGVLTADDFAETGAVKLTAATTASEEIALPSGANWYLDLNGQTLTLNTVKTLFTVGTGRTLTITDESGATGADWTEATGGKGIITRDPSLSGDNDGMINVTGGTFNFEGGTFTGLKSAGRGTVSRFYDGTFNMNGGKISDNTTSYHGGAIFIGDNAASNKATFNMTNGLISGNSAAVGGAIAVGKAGTNVANISGGEISGNSATHGGAVSVTGGGVVTISGDAVIEDNTAKNYGGALYLNATGTINVAGGVITGNKASRGGAISTHDGTANVDGYINISGGEIYGNQVTGSACAANIYTNTGAVVAISGGEIYGGLDMDGNVVSGASAAEDSWIRDSVLTISGDPTATICPAGTTTTTIGGLKEDASIKWYGGSLTGDATVLKTAGDGYQMYTYQKPALITKGDLTTGEYVLSGNVELTGTLNVKNGNDVVIDLNGHTISMVDGTSTTFFYVYAGGKLTIKDSVGTGKVQFKEMTGSGGISNYGTFVLEGGELTGWTRASMGGFIDLWANSTFKMTGGKITDVSATTAGVVRTQSGPVAVEFTGGEISGNTMTNDGGDIMRLGLNGTASTIHFGGDFKITNNKHKGGVDYTAETRDVQAYDAIVTIDGNAELNYFTLNNGTLNSEGGTYDAANGDARYGRIDVSGSPVVKGIYRSTSAITLNISDLTDGASISTLNGAVAQSTDKTVGAATYDNTEVSGLAKDKGTTYSYKVPTYAVTVKTAAGGTIEVDKTEGADGETITVTATPDEGYELEAILVNGEAIEGNTFQISAEVGAYEVTATFKATDVALPNGGNVDAGEYVLDADVVLESTLTFKGETVIDLNGHTISYAGATKAAVLSVAAGGKLTIKDSVGTGKVQFITSETSGVLVSGDFVLEGGTLTGYYRAGAGALFTLYAGANFTMTGGSISGNGSDRNAVMRAEQGNNNITITGGEITGNWNKELTYLICIGNAKYETQADNTKVQVRGTAQSTLTIGGDAYIGGNAYGGDTFAESTLWNICGTVEINAYNTDVLIEDNADVSYVRIDGDPATLVEEGTAYPVSTITVTDSAKVAGMTWSTSNRSSSQVIGLSEDAEAKVFSKAGVGVGYIEEMTVVATRYDDTATLGEYAKGYVYTWRDPATVYAVTVGEVVNGTVTVDPAEGVYGTTVTVTATANEGYELEAILVNGKAIDGNTFTIGLANAEVTATFVEAAAATYDVVVIDPLGGSVSVDKNNAAEGETITITATADEGYELTAILVNGEAIEGTTFEMPAADVQVTATFTAVEPEGFPTAGNLTAGEYVLDKDIYLTNTLYVKGEVTIDLAGYSIYAKQGEGETVSSGIFDVNGEGYSLTINDSVGTGKLVACNTNGGSSPAVFVQKGTFTLNAGEITGWVREGAGGMIYVNANGTFIMNGGKLTGASAQTGSAIRTTTGCTVAINGGEISDNTATDGSVIQLNTGVNFTMTGGAIKDNDGISGGAIYTASDITITGGEISGNTATKYAGGIYVVSGATATLTNVAIKDNVCTDTSSTSSSYGGGIYVDNGAALIVNEGTVISGNSAVRGGGISTKEPASATTVVTINGGTIENNHAINRGANLYTYDSTLTIAGGTIGGAVYGADKKAATADLQNVQVRGGIVNVTGGTLAALDLGGNAGSNSDWGTLTISGAPAIAALNVKAGLTAATIGGLTSGAVINTTEADALTIAENDETVAHTAGTKLYQFAGDLGLADKFVAGTTVTLTENSSVGGGIALTEAGEYTLDLAGFELTGNMAPYFTIGSGVKLTIIDSSETKTGKIVGLTTASNAMILVDGGSFSLAGGTLTGHTNTSYGGAIYAPTAGSYVAISGGEISGNTAHRGGAISTKDTSAAIDVTIEISGGIVTGNTTNRGATIYTQTGATVIISGGKVGYGTVTTTNAETGEVTVEPATVTVSGKEDLWIRNSKVTVTGGDIGGLYFNGNAANGYTMAISGNPTIEMLNGVATDTGTIGKLVTGARVATSNARPLTVLENDETVHVKNNLYRFVGDVGPVARVLIVGNSFAGDTTSYLDALSAYFNVELEHAYLYIGSQNIRWHAQSLAETLRKEDLNGDGRIGDSRSSKDELYGYGNLKDVSIPEAMTDGEWDYVVLQPGVEYVGYEGTYNSDIDFLMDYIAAVQPNAKILWSQTWAVDKLYYDVDDVDEGTASENAGWHQTSSYLTQFGGSQEAMYDAILRNTDKFIAGDDARFDFDGWLPIGIAIQEMRNGYTDTSSLETYLATRLTRDGFHLSGNAGRMIAGLVTMKTLFPEQVDLDAITVDDLTGLFANFYGNDYRADTFEATEANVNKLLAAVKTAYGHAVAGTVPAYGDGTANKQFNPDAAGDYVAVYEGVTEMGNLAVSVAGEKVVEELYATAGAGKIVIYKGDEIVGTIDELWLEKNAGIVLTDRYTKLTNGEEYFILADAQAPQLAMVGSKLYLTFDVKLYSDTQNTIINGGVYMTSFDGETWTKAVKVSDAPMAYGLTTLDNGNLLLSVADTSTKVLTLTTAGEVINTVELADAGIADVAFAEVAGKVFALTSNGAMYVSADNGASWTATAVANGITASPDLVVILDDVKLGSAIYATWSDEAERDIYGKIWTIAAENTDDYGWNNTEATVVAEYTISTAYNGKASGGQPVSVLDAGATTSNKAVVRTYYVSENAYKSIDRGIVVFSQLSATLSSSIGFNVFVPKGEVDAMNGKTAVITQKTSEGDIVTTEVLLANTPTQKISGVVNYRFIVSLVAKQMGDDVTVTVYDGDGKQLTIDYTYALTDYVDRWLVAYASNAEARTLAVDLLNYGAAAQNYTEYNLDKLVNARLTEEQQSWATPELVLDEDLINEEQRPDGTSSALSLKNVVELKLLYPTATVSEAAYGKITYVKHDGSTITEDIKKVKYNNTYDMINIDSLATADVFALVTCELYDAENNPIEGTLMKTNISSYAYKSIKAYGSTSKVSVVTMRLMQLGVSTYAFMY